MTASASPRLRILVPVKRLDDAKSRLAGLLSLEERRALVLAMLSDVLGAILDAGLCQPEVLSQDPGILDHAGRLGANPLQERPGLSLSASLDAVLTDEPRAEASLVVFADLPLLRSSDVEHFTAFGRADPAVRPRVVAAPDRSGTGTNALWRAPATAIAARYGPGSLGLHQQTARTAGASFDLVRLGGFAHDLDTPADLIAALEVEADSRSLRLLRSLNIPRRISRADAPGGPLSRRGAS
ncbi:MAG: 2-phospho-L-lactate guanylyltransferase [Chloroflexi bacterium]|nr:2-phospho-L-lactate guanylyltransferase [Chloroflexota bacterium]